MLVVGDAYVPGFFPLSNGVNKGFDRIALLNKAGGIKALVPSEGKATPADTRSIYNSWADSYNAALGLKLTGSRQAAQNFKDFKYRAANRVGSLPSSGNELTGTITRQVSKRSTQPTSKRSKVGSKPTSERKQTWRG